MIVLEARAEAIVTAEASAAVRGADLVVTGSLDVPTHGLGAVDGLAEQVGVPGMLGGLREDVEQDAPRGPARSRREPRRLRQGV